MHPAIAEKLEALPALCAKHRVKRLEIFGSATSDNFDPAKSDVDFLVDFQSVVPGELANAYFGLLADLEALFHREVDLVSAQALTNPYVLRVIQRSRMTLYAA
jgi:hypothetical protein